VETRNKGVLGDGAIPEAGRKRKVCGGNDSKAVNAPKGAKVKDNLAGYFFLREAPGAVSNPALPTGQCPVTNCLRTARTAK
jgi:hypothetical protein